MTERDQVLERYADLMQDDTKEMLLALPDGFLDSVLPDLETIARVRGEAILSVIATCAETAGLPDEWVRGAGHDVRSQYGLTVIEQVMDALSELLLGTYHVGDYDEEAMLGAVAKHVRMVARGLEAGEIDPLAVGRDDWTA